MSQREEPLSVAGPRGTLRGIRHHPDRDSGWTALFLHGWFSCTHVGPARLYVQVARALAKRGVESLRLDTFGVGDSDGDESDNRDFSAQTEDYLAILRTLPLERRVLLVGHSLGASQSLVLAERLPQVRSLLWLGPGLGPMTTPEGFLSQAAADPDRWVVIDASLGIDAVSAAVDAAVGS